LPPSHSAFEHVKVDVESLRAARMKYRRVVRQLEEGKRPHDDILHPAYKLGQFLDDALGPIWRAMDERAPDYPDGSNESRSPL
jgi:hypothetical protein